MSALTNRAAAAKERTPQIIAAPRLPGLWTAVRVEVAKLTSQLTLRAALVLCVVLPIGFAIGMRLQPGRPADTLFGRWAGQSGFATSLTMLFWATAWGAPVLAGLFAGDIFASEDRHNTWKTILTRSTTRTRLFAGKAIATAICVWGAFALLAVASTMAGIVLIGNDSLIGLSGQLIGPRRALALVAAAWALCLVWTSIYVALGLLLSIAVRSGIVGVLGPLVAAIALQLLDTIGSGRIVRTLLPSTPSDAWHALFTDPIHGGPIVQALLTSLIYAIVLSSGAWWLLARRDFAGAAEPASQRRTTVRSGIALAALTGVLAAISGAGPTALTASAMNRSIAQTFGNLTNVAYTWRTGKQPDTTIPWHAVCSRGGTQIGATRSPDTKGAGDDWACMVTDLRASDGLGAITVDVTLKANGCYTVQSPPGAVGGLHLNDDSGQSFTNPLYAFDGCLGSP